MKIRVAHIEAGLRTYDKYRPYPEEANRAMISKIADLHFAPTSESAKNLIKEGVPRNSIIITGNTAIDALLYIKNNKKDFDAGLLRNLPKDKRIILVTAHRRENFGKPIKDICEALRILAKSCGDIIIIYPVHRNPNILRPVMSHIGGIKNIMLLDPLGYGDFVKLMDRACLILTDSGGIQEEAPSLGKPVLILRDKTERPEVVRAGCAKIVGTDTKKIVRHSRALLKSKRCYNGMSIKKNPVGDGKAALRIKKALDNLYRC